MVTVADIAQYEQLRKAIDARVQQIFAIWKGLRQECGEDSSNWWDKVTGWFFLEAEQEVYVEISIDAWEETHWQFPTAFMFLPEDQLEGAVTEAFQAWLKLYRERGW